MAFYGIPAGYPLLYPSHLVHGPGPILQYPHHAAPAFPAQPCLQYAQSAQNNASLANRITLLETQLAQVMADKKAADNATLHLLRLQTSQPLANTQDAGGSTKAAVLDRELLQATVENYRLKDELRKVLEERERETSLACMTPVTDSSQSMHNGRGLESSNEAADPKFDVSIPKPEDLLDLTGDEEKRHTLNKGDEDRFSSDGGYDEGSRHVAVKKAKSAFPTLSISPGSSYVYHFDERKAGCHQTPRAKPSYGLDAHSLLATNTADLLLSTQASFSKDKISSVLPNTKHVGVEPSQQLRPGGPIVSSTRFANSFMSGGAQVKDEISAAEPSKVQDVKYDYPSRSDAATHISTKGSVPGNVEPPWQTKDIFDSIEQRKRSVSQNRAEAGKDDLLFPDMFKHGLQYDPGPNARDVIRTLTVGNLPAELTIAELMNAIRGGPIVDVKMLDTTTITGTRTALVTFLQEHSALAFEDYADTHGITFHGQRAHVLIVTTPTYPMSYNRSVAIFTHHRTRCLEIHNFPRRITPIELRRDIRVSPVLTFDVIESLKMNKAGVLEARFTSIWYAGRAYGFLSSYGKYRGCKVMFSPDPCALPLEVPTDKKNGVDTAATNNINEAPQSTFEGALHDLSEDSTLADDGSGHSSDAEDMGSKPGKTEKDEQLTENS